MEHKAWDPPKTHTHQLRELEPSKPAFLVCSLIRSAGFCWAGCALRCTVPKEICNPNLSSILGIIIITVKNIITTEMHKARYIKL